jgi:outer membrane protein assembly factor BamB
MSDRRGHTNRFRSSSAWRRTFAVSAILALFGGLTATAANGAAAGAAVPAAVATPAAANATAYQIDPMHDGQQTDPAFGVAQQAKLWSHNFGGTVNYPLIVGDKIFVDAENSTGYGSYYGTNVSAFDIRDGSRLWGPINIGGLGSLGTLTYDNGTVFALNFDGQLFAFDAATGHQKWSVQLPWQWVFTSPPTAANGVLYVNGSGYAGTLYAVSEATGAVIWHALVQNGDHSAPAVDSTGVYVAFACAQSYSFSLAGAFRWWHDTYCEGGGGRTPVLHGGSLYVRDAEVGSAALSAADGSLQQAFSSDTAPAFIGNLMVTVLSGKLHVTNVATHKPVWSRTDADYVSAPLIVNGLVVEGDATGVVHLMDSNTGAEVWHASAGAPIAAPDEQDPNALTGMAEGDGILAVPAGEVLTVFGRPTTPARAAINPLPTFAAGWTVSPAWQGGDAGNGVSSYDVRYRVAPANGSFGPYQEPTALQATTTRSVTLSPGQGRTVCTSVRARDRAGSVSAWSPDACQTVLLDDRAFTATGSWYRPSGLVGYAAGTLSAASARGASLSFVTEQTRQVELIGTTCPACGRVSVSYPGVTPMVVNMQSATVGRRAFVLPAFAAPISGRLTLTALDTGKPIYIDAAAIRHG